MGTKAVTIVRDIPRNIKEILLQNDYFGFKNLFEATNFVIANADWSTALKDLKMKSSEIKIIDEWRTNELPGNY